MTVVLVLFGIFAMLEPATGKTHISRPIEVACEGEMMNLDCPPNSGIEVLSANYGRTNKKLCKNVTDQPINEMSCISIGSKDIIERKCNTRRHCSMMTGNSQMGGDPCPGVEKYVDVIYRCVRRFDPTPTTRPSTTTRNTMKPSPKRVTTTPYLENRTVATEKIIEPNTTVKIKAILTRNGGGGFFRSMLVLVSLVKDKPKHSLLSVLTGVAAGTVIILVSVLVCVCAKKRSDKKRGDSVSESEKKKAEITELETGELLGEKPGRNSDSAQSARSDDHVDSAFGDDEPDRGKPEEFELSNDLAYLDGYLEAHNQNRSLPRYPSSSSSSQNPRGSLKMSRRAHNDGSRGRSYDYSSNNDSNLTTFS